MTAGGPPPGDRGAVTVEAAIALCALTTVFALLLAGCAAIVGQVRCVDAAGAAARLAARGQEQAARDSVADIAPAGALLTLRVQGDLVEAEVLAEPVGGLLPGVHLRGTAHAALEPGADSKEEGGEQSDAANGDAPSGAGSDSTGPASAGQNSARLYGGKHDGGG